MLKLVISQTSNQPIYEQIKNQIKKQIIEGSLKAGNSLPSIRVLAKELNVSVITTKRAYEELEKEGFIVTVPARGTFVADIDKEKISTLGVQEIENDLKAIVQKAKILGVDLKKLLETIERLYKGEEGQR
ncbi:GntR family transcriptional regulator [Caldicellulosiruptor bescii]|uniref:Transcriptional regulator, GntR family n=2 Tax=Caldicellulosiruptor bescii TaxID=31899 RepID=B9MLR8_CALBD|nr:GntR family transcriptional regulator [Caldicellulosiruptor bescii]ACM59276.1 transcriptional regulator, GntR family [Caldicellulosiruptor bescii DSM 6725]PBC88267.1 GntR family transcriptional regulator [Caldicellulosiruptor bescii]PBC92252.1 GntR family transcriptional regulator [Caldicellulosiruptor bescii]PBD04939.1 GntR family transcriptional regulator [Caldicellulosiruptor bescii]PBD05431.1 GntR family transcriptional regulator [Caldicellulosiruptor bescii]